MRYRVFLRMVVTAAFISVGFSLTAMAQDAAPAAKAPADKGASHSSSGIKASIGNITVNERNLVVQYAVENDTKNRVYLFVVGSMDASLTTGEFMTLREVVGPTWCRNGSNDSESIRNCLHDHKDDTDYYTYIEPGEFTTVAFKYEVNNFTHAISSDAALSFAFRAVVREGPPDSEVLTGASKTIAPPHVVTINFPLVPLRE